MGRYISSRRQAASSSLSSGDFQNLSVAGWSALQGNVTASSNLVVNGSSSLRNATIGSTLSNTFTVNASSEFKAPVVFQADASFFSTGALTLPAGSTSQRPLVPNLGATRFNSTLANLEFWSGSAWTIVGTGAGDGNGATGGGTDKVFYENDQIINTSYALTSGKNAVTAGPVRIMTGATVTIPSGAGWAVV